MPRVLIPNLKLQLLAFSDSPLFLKPPLNNVYENSENLFKKSINPTTLEKLEKIAQLVQLLMS